MDVRALNNLKVAAIGPKTSASLKEHGILPDRQAKEFRAEGLLAAFSTEDIKGQRFYLPRAAEEIEALVGGHG